MAIKLKKVLFRKIVICAICINIFYCNPETDLGNHVENTYEYSMPESINDGWTAGTLEDVGIDVSKIEKLANKRLNGSYSKLFSISIARKGKLVFDEYFPGVDTYGNQINPGETYLQRIQSSTKSIASTALGVAKYNRYDIDLEEKYAEIFIDYQVDWSGMKGDIKLIHVLTMSAGLNWDE